MVKRLEDLDIFQLSDAFSNEIWAVVIAWDFFAKDTIGKQLVRSTDSISANIAEGYGRYHFKENKNFCYFSRGSIIETKSWLLKAKARNLISESQFNSFISRLETIHLKLNAYIKSIGNSPKFPTNDQ